MVTKNLQLLKTRLKRFLDRLESNQKVNERDLDSVLYDTEMKRMNFEWENAKAFKENIAEMAEELSDYTRMLHTADKVFAIAENKSSLPRAQIKRHYNEAETRYESALEHLQELLSGNPHLQIALDRLVSFEAGEECEPGPSSVPRHALSRSHHVIPKKWQTIRSIRIDALKDKLARIEGGTTLEADTQAKTDVVARAAQLRKLVRRFE